VALGHTDWKRSLDWKAWSSICLADGQHGWPRQWPCPKDYATSKLDGTPLTSWAEAWAYFLIFAPEKGDPTRGNESYTIPKPSTWPAWPAWVPAGPEVNIEARVFMGIAAIALANAAAVPGAPLAYSNLRALLLANTKSGTMYFRCAFASS
jgi:hypothetical protein